MIYVYVQVKWLSNDEKGLIDFSDFSSDMKNNNLSSPPKPKQGTRYVIYRKR